MRKTRLLVGLSLLLIVSACGGPAADNDAVGGDEGASDAPIAPRQPDHFDHASRPYRHLDSPDRVGEAFADGTATFEARESFRQLGFMFDAPPGTELEWRRPGDGEWRPVEVTWHEDGAYVARLVLEEPIEAIQLRPSAPLESLFVEFYEEVLAPVEDDSSSESRIPSTEPHTPSSPEGRVPTTPEDDVRTTRQREAPESLVIPRNDWGARDPNCLGSPHDPSRMTIHHTASPDNDGGDPARRMRQMQNYHMDSNGWCDIGYHFVVSQSGKIFQGRESEQRTGAHVGGHNTNNVGISLIGNFDEQTVGSTQFDATVEIVDWVRSTYNIALDRAHLKGHTEWSGQGTSCPGNDMLNRLDELIRKVKDGGGGGEVEWEIDIDTELRGAANFYEQGTSRDRPDALPGDTINAEIYVTNQSPEPIREVWVGYDFSADHLEATNYTIYSDHPEYDRSSWDVNDADSADENPDKSDLGDRGQLYLYAFSPNETKRIHVELRAQGYSAGTTSLPFVRGWVRHVKDVYGTKDGWGADPSTDKVGRQLRAESHLDVLSRDTWHFNNEESTDNLEGWTARGAYEELTLSHNTNAMATKVIGDDARVVSPAWTRIDAETYDQMVLRVRSHDGPHPTAIHWRGEDQEFTDARSLRFEFPGDGDFHTFRLPLGDHADWSGSVTQLRIDPLDERAPGDEAEGWYDTDGLYFRSTADGATTAETIFEDGTLVEPIEESDDEDGGDDDSDEMSTGDPPTGGEGAEKGSGNASDDGLVSSRNMEHVQVNEGCSAAGTTPRPASPAWLLILALAGLVRRMTAKY